jgi:hypothetical protein
MMDWQPIETAPKDGSFVLAYNAGSMFQDMVEETMWIVQFSGGRWRIALDGQSAQPTHWMPLPAPPAPNQNGG